jgi:hypothetical protein
VSVAADAAPGTAVDVAVIANSTIGPATFDTAVARVVLPSPPPSAGVPDLLVASLYYSPPIPGVASVVVFEAQVSNIGSGPAGVFGVRFILDGDLELGRATIDGLSEGVKVSAFSETWNATTGNHSILAIVDDVEAVAESDEGNNRYSATLEVGRTPVVATSLAEAVLGLAAQPAVIASAGVVGLSLLAFATERTRYRLFLLGVPLYHRLTRDEVLDHGMRNRLHERIMESPGVSYSDLKRGFALNNGTLSHHLWMLQRQQLITARPDGLRKRFFPYGPRVTFAGSIDPRQRVAALVKEEPGIAQKEISERLGLSKQLVNYHVRSLERRGELLVERSWRAARCFPIDAEHIRDERRSGG